MEVFIVRLDRALLLVLLAGTAAANIEAGRTAPRDISQYYGFEEIETVKLDWGIKDLRIADFNRDGRNDIAIVNNRKARIELLIQKETIGPDEAEVTVDSDDVDVNVIAPPTRFAAENIAVSQKLFSLVTGDLNSDGLADLVFYGEPKGLYVILQNTDGAGSENPESLSWMTRRKIPLDDGLSTSNALVCGDLNGDGADDLALAGRDGVYIILQKDDGSLAEPVKYPTSGRTLSVQISDLNGDSRNDLVLVTSDAEKPIHVRFGLKTGQLGPQVKFFMERPFALPCEDIDGTVGDEGGGVLLGAVEGDVHVLGVEQHPGDGLQVADLIALGLAQLQLGAELPQRALQRPVDGRTLADHHRADRPAGGALDLRTHQTVATAGGHKHNRDQGQLL